MRIGVDFDNTIAGYDRLFAQLATERGITPGSAQASKRDVRDQVRRQRGDIEWQRLQALAYGQRMGEAKLLAGVADFFHRCRGAAIPVFIVSHKTRNASTDAAVDLRRAALDWMTSNGFFAPDGLGLERREVFFEDTRQAKIDRIRDLGCSHFIDDLVEVFDEPSFPRDVEAVLYAPDGEHTSGPYRAFDSWIDITEHLLGTQQ